ncbi:TIGR02530 family flagellar biosynthesis protein [Pseudalkalibacillus berkeleyi]|uniref:Flagellar protein n=1 Tax=Pseudalkalibacillus berkeleyi TaxID=1069813 RepID=A0ABS9GWD8_9BACL|nr:TIGR02530 family flagellar biosynthesis protein [Pseudalkalibacillus berkeleyi]MCF6137112.1 hypothetical protein [Pseudalkalibacillus berkeleyi]
MQRIYQSPITSSIQPNSKVVASNKRDTSTFKDYLHGQVKELKVSKHAGTRLAERNINIDQPTWDRISIKLSEANDKGIKDSLVLVGEAALVVNTDNNTVITAMNRKEASDHIFSNINGAIVLN